MADEGSRYWSSSRATTAIALQEGGDSMDCCHGGGRPSLRPLFQARGRRPRFKPPRRHLGGAVMRCWSLGSRILQHAPDERDYAQVKSQWDSGYYGRIQVGAGPVPCACRTSWVARSITCPL
ncbi:hypothetical protein PHYSODRAFT_285002 [Phytophthora sojae]|uniref:Uncharacterized protein n=1 Tax=Phytophthora sojae (strain P6497) TaxID=1094619 RepID=G4YVC2_PHYSP|nr:hypothetical protein PHYSODRAFT_285002 [Phytophthora sojae]EGZ24928.1 hypothetical protein PHYSODRAFT_285002 [Phytophthora sojae]|eukprot:XP_009520216.1 hypothetical protein PHYSODRAFT_285002 [Phytophthora sojae]